MGPSVSGESDSRGSSKHGQRSQPRNQGKTTGLFLLFLPILLLIVFCSTRYEQCYSEHSLTCFLEDTSLCCGIPSRIVRTQGFPCVRWGEQCLSQEHGGRVLEGRRLCGKALPPRSRASTAGPTWCGAARSRCSSPSPACCRPRGAAEPPPPGPAGPWSPDPSPSPPARAP